MLLPGFGDAAGVLLSISILFSAARLGVPYLCADDPAVVREPDGLTFNC